MCASAAVTVSNITLASPDSTALSDGASPLCGKTRKGNAWVRRLLCEFAQAASRSRCALKDKFAALTLLLRLNSGLLDELGIFGDL